MSGALARAAWLAAVLFATPAAAAELGLGVAAGASFSPAAVHGGPIQRQAGDRLAGGFFVDVPMSGALALSPSATVYALNLGSRPSPATDLHLAVKAVLPVSLLRLAGGVGTGVTHVERGLFPHLGAQLQLALHVADGIDVFVAGHYRHVMRRPANIEAVQGLVGAVFLL